MARPIDRLVRRPSHTTVAVPVRMASSAPTGERRQRSAHRRSLADRRERSPLGDEEAEHGERDHRFLDVEAFDDVQHGRQRGDRDREQPRPSLAAPHAPAQPEQGDASGGDERRSGLGHGDRNEVAEDVEPAPERRGDGRQEVHDARDGEDRAGLPARPAPAADRRRRCRPVSAAGERRDHCGFGTGSGPGREVMRSPASGRDVDARVQQPDVQVGTGLELDPRHLALRDQDRRQPPASRSRTHDDAAAPVVGVEAVAERGQLGVGRVCPVMSPA